MRPTRDQTYLEMCHILAKRGTCVRRSVGCILVDKDGFPLSVGYNGVAAGRPHCNDYRIEFAGNMSQGVRGILTRTVYDHKCPGADDAPGQGLDSCQAIHAEQNALMRCSDPRLIHTVYCTASPCISCVKMLLGTSAKRVVFSEEYPHPIAKTWWLESGGEWIQIEWASL